MAEINGGKFGEGLTTSAINKLLIAELQKQGISGTDLRWISAALGEAIDGGQGGSIADSATRNNALSKEDKEEYERRKEAGENVEELNEEFLQRSKDNDNTGSLVEDVFYYMDKDGNWIEYNAKLPTSEDIHKLFDTLGFMPLIGTSADFANGVYYITEGDLKAAGWSFVGAASGGIVKIIGKSGKVFNVVGTVSEGKLFVKGTRKASEELTSLYRAVGPEEFYSTMKTGKFSISMKGTEAKYFGLNFEETLKFANNYSDIGAIIEVKISPEMLKKFAGNPNVDTYIFKSGTIIIPADKLSEFNKVIKELNHKL